MIRLNYFAKKCYLNISSEKDDPGTKESATVTENTHTKNNKKRIKSRISLGHLQHLLFLRTSGQKIKKYIIAHIILSLKQPHDSTINNYDKCQKSMGRGSKLSCIRQNTDIGSKG